MTPEEAWRHVLAQAPAKDAKDAEAIAVLGMAVFENLASIAQSLERLAASIDTPNEYGETGSAAIARGIVQGLRG